jgi:aspartyl-tRNA(Asn)/glutamyl-tRNA(Gln) amidotransferase subunit B
MSEYTATIGLEIHAELATKTKMFCACRNDADEKRPNVNICPVCMAYPGTLPVINKEAVHKVLLVGTALSSTLADYTEFDRKNYFYPDIPKGYQISQYAYPLIQGGSLRGVALTRIHLEEDTARSQHASAGTAQAGGDVSLVDYNRAGVPLMELVTEPVIHDAQTASSFARELQLLLRYLGAGEANMEKGEMRVEANISVAPVSDPGGDGKPKLGTKVEVKNLNSFRSVERAVAYEIDRQTKLLKSGGVVVQETRGWDESRQCTFSQRKKESSEDYRYFPEPDLPKLMVSEIPEFSVEALHSGLPALPWERRTVYIEELGLKADDAEMFVRDPLLGNFFDAARQHANSNDAKHIANYIVSDVAGKREAGELPDAWLHPANARRFAMLIDLVEKAVLSSRGAKDTLTLMLESVDDPEALARSHGLIQKSDEGFLTEVVRGVIAANPTIAADYRAGKEAALQYLIGQGMKQSKGAANPGVLRQHLIDALM